MAIKNWHPAKIGLAWALPLIFLVLQMGTSMQTDDSTVLTYAVLWVLTTGVAWIITWKWLNAREEDRKKKETFSLKGGNKE